MDGKRERERSFFPFFFFLSSFLCPFLRIPLPFFLDFVFQLVGFQFVISAVVVVYFDEVDHNSEITYNFCRFNDRSDWLYFQSLEKFKFRNLGICQHLNLIGKFYIFLFNNLQI